MTVWIGILADGYFCRGNYCFALVLVTGGSRNPWVFQSIYYMPDTIFLKANDADTDFWKLLDGQ